MPFVITPVSLVELLSLPMLSSIEKLPEVQKATDSFIALLKRAARRLPANRSQMEGDLSLFVSNLWDKLETEITSEFKGESSPVEKGDPSRRVLFGTQGCPEDCNLNHPIAVFARRQGVCRSTVYRWKERGLPVQQTRIGPRINCQQARAFLSNKPQA
jgi:hypothetical protein